MLDRGARQGHWVRRIASSLLRIVLIAAITFTLLEIAARIRAGRAPESNRLDLAITANAFPQAYSGRCGGTSDAPLGALIRPSRVPDLLFELKHGLDTCFFGARVTINADGFRAPRLAGYTRPKPTDVYRVLLLGDSQTFGQGVRYEQTFGARLEAELQRRAKTQRVEVINTGVPAYNTVQEAAFFDAKGIAYRPDCAVILFIGNDFDLSEFLLEPEAGGLALDRSFALSVIDLLRWWSKRRLTRDRSEPRPTLFARVPREYRHMVGFDAYRGALRRIAQTARPAGIPVVNVADYRGAGLERDRCNERDLADLQLELGIHYARFDYPGDERYWLSSRDHHLNDAGTVELTRRALGGILRGCPPLR
jgi:hypothetical protein